MDKIELVHQRDQLLNRDIIFNRPISGLSRIQVALFGGKKGSLATLSQLYSANLAMGLSPVCVVESRAGAKELLPVGSMMLSVSKKNSAITETAEVLSFVERANLAILAPDAELGSALQILFEKLYLSTKTPLIITDEAVGLYGFLPHKFRKRKDTLIFVSAEGLVKLVNQLGLAVPVRPGRGVYNVVSLADAVSDELAAHVVVYTSDMVVARDTSNHLQRGVVHVASGSVELHRGLLLGLMAGLLGDFSQSLSGVLDKVLVAGYLFNDVTLGARELRDPILAERLIKETLQRELQ